MKTITLRYEEKEFSKLEAKKVAHSKEKKEVISWEKFFLTIL